MYRLMEGVRVLEVAQMTFAPANQPIGAYRTSDGRWLELAMLQPCQYWPEFCSVVGCEDLITDERFATVEKIMANTAEVAEIVAEILAERTYAEWVERFEGMRGRGRRCRTRARLATTRRCAPTDSSPPLSTPTDARGSSSPTPSSSMKPRQPCSVPQFAEHADEVLRELGWSDRGVAHPQDRRRDHMRPGRAPRLYTGEPH